MPAGLRLNVFTPLPPAMTDIGGHSAGMLPHLARRAEVTVWTAETSLAAPEIDGVAVRSYDPAELPHEALNGANATFFNFGNNARFHGEIFRAASAVPGIAILHDLNMQHFFAGLATSRAGAMAYVGLMRRHHGEAAGAAAERFVSGALPVSVMVDEYPLSLGVAGRALAVVTHNEQGAEGLRAQTRLPVHYVPLSLDCAGIPAPARRPAEPPYRLVMFGHIGANRRLSSVLHALAALPSRGLFTLDIYGEIEDRAGAEALIERLRLRDRVACRGFVPSADLARALDEAHLAINLRVPTMGEASGSQLRIWAHALPSLVSRIGWYGGLPADAVRFVDPEAEQADLIRHLAAFPGEQAAFIAAGRRGREIVATVHSPEAYADALVRIAAQAPVLSRRRGAMDLAEAAAAAAVQLAGSEALPPLAPTAAQRITELFGAPRSGRDVPHR